MRLSRQPCPDCNDETLHNKMKCTVCGHINLTPSQQRSLAFRRHGVRVRRGQAPTVDNQAAVAARRAEHLATPCLSDGKINGLARDGKL
jgi:hypothetical protein